MSRTFRKIGRFSPVMYTKRTGIWAMSSLPSGAVGCRGPSGGGRGILLVHEPLADLDDVALGVREPGGLPARDEAVERERPQGEHGLGAHPGEMRVHVVHLERQVAHAVVVGA